MVDKDVGRLKQLVSMNASIEGMNTSVAHSIGDQLALADSFDINQKIQKYSVFGGMIGTPIRSPINAIATTSDTWGYIISN